MNNGKGKWSKADIISLLVGITGFIFGVSTFWFSYEQRKDAKAEMLQARQITAKAERLEMKKEAWIATLTDQLKEKNEQITQIENELHADSVRLTFNSLSERDKVQQRIDRGLPKLESLQEEIQRLEQLISDLRSN